MLVVFTAQIHQISSGWTELSLNMLARVQLSTPFVARSRSEEQGGSLREVYAYAFCAGTWACYPRE
jgi:hypothetical protein